MPSLNGDRRQHQPVELSYSWLNTLVCPYRLQQLQLRGWQEEDSADASFGTWMHTTAALYGMECVKRRKFRDVKLYSWAMDQVVDKFHIDVDTEVKMQELGEVFLPMWSLDVAATRHSFEERLFLSRNELGDRLAGTPDHVAYYGNRAVINDFKFGKSRLLQFDEAQHDRQVALYSFLVLSLHPELDEVTVNLIAPAYGPQNMSSGSFTRTTLGFVTDWIYAGWAIIDRLRKDYGEQDWPTFADNDVCKWCDLICPAIREVRVRYGG